MPIETAHGVVDVCFAEQLDKDTAIGGVVLLPKRAWVGRVALSSEWSGDEEEAVRELGKVLLNEVKEECPAESCGAYRYATLTEEDGIRALGTGAVCGIGLSCPLGLSSSAPGQ